MNPANSCSLSKKFIDPTYTYWWVLINKILYLSFFCKSCLRVHVIEYKLNSILEQTVYKQEKKMLKLLNHLYFTSIGITLAKLKKTKT